MKHENMILAADSDSTRQRCVSAFRAISDLDHGIVVPMSVMELQMPAASDLFATQTKRESVLQGLMACLGAAPVIVTDADDADVYLHQLQSVLTTETIAEVRFFRNIEFAVEVLEDDSSRGDGMAFHNAVKSLKAILASQPNPTAASSLLSALAPARLALPQLQEALDAGKAMRVGQQVSQLRAVR